MLRKSIFSTEEKTVSVRNNADGQNIMPGIREKQGQVAEVIVFTAIRDGFQVFSISSVGDADT